MVSTSHTQLSQPSALLPPSHTFQSLGSSSHLSSSTGFPSASGGSNTVALGGASNVLIDRNEHALVNIMCKYDEALSQT